MRGEWTDMVRFELTLPDLYPDSHFSKKAVKATDMGAYECPKCNYNAPEESWGFWSQHKKPTSQQWKILKELTQGPKLVF